MPPVEWATLAIAIIGALTGLSSLGWQIYSYLDTRRPRVEVTVGNAVVFPAYEPIHVIDVTVVNKNDHAIRIQSVGLNMQDNSGRLIFVHPVPGVPQHLPGEIPPHDSRSAFLEYTEFEQAMNPKLPVVAAAVTSAHGTFESKPTRLG